VTHRVIVQRIQGENLEKRLASAESQEQLRGPIVVPLPRRGGPLRRQTVLPVLPAHTGSRSWIAVPWVVRDVAEMAV
jgi:hypothetical protein